MRAECFPVFQNAYFFVPRCSCGVGKRNCMEYEYVSVCTSWLLRKKEEKHQSDVGLPLSLLLQSQLKDPTGVNSGPPFVTHPQAASGTGWFGLCPYNPNPNLFKELLQMPVDGQREQTNNVSEGRWGWRACLVVLSSQMLAQLLPYPQFYFGWDCSGIAAWWAPEKSHDPLLLTEVKN